MTYAIGDPDHIEVHESIRLLFMAAGLDPDLIPGTATIGATGHVDDHNRIADALAWLDENGVIGGYADVSATTGSPTVSTVTVDGDAGTLYDFGANGSITMTAGRARVTVIGGGGGYWASNGDGTAGEVVDGWFDFTAGTHTVTVGANVAGLGDGGKSSIGSIVGANGGQAGGYMGAGMWIAGTRAAGKPSGITGSSVTYGKTGGTPTYYGDGGTNGVASIAGRVFVFIPD